MILVTVCGAELFMHVYVYMYVYVYMSYAVYSRIYIHI